MKRLFLILAAALCCFEPLAAQATLRVGTLTAIPGLLDPIKAALEKEKGIRLEYTQKGGVDLFLDLEAGKLDVLVLGTSLESLLELAKARNHPVKLPYEYPHCQVGEDQLSVLVNPDVLTDAQMLAADLNRETLKGLFTGKFKNWKEVGGPDLPVVVVACTTLQVTNAVFRTSALDGEDFAPGHRTVGGTLKDIIEAINTTKGAISIGPLALTAHSKIWSPVQATKVVRPFTLIASAKSTPEVKKAVAGLTEFLLGPGKAMAYK